MSIRYTILLIIGAIATLFFVLRKIRKSEIKISDSVFWFLFAGSFVVLAIFPQIAFFFAELLEVESPANIVFLYVIAVLLIREFTSTVEISQLRSRIALLAQKKALEGVDKRRNEK